MYRHLTDGEKQMAALIFQDAIDYKKVRIYNRHWLFLPKSQIAMTPRGHIFFPKASYEQDFSCTSDAKKQWFIHEMAHIWQYQLGYPVLWAGIMQILKGGYFRSIKGQPAAYYFDPAREPLRNQLAHFNMEQQADIISFYFAYIYLHKKAYAWLSPFFSRVLPEFLHNPKQKKLLPKNNLIDWPEY